jgi:hypothetical protein
LSEAVASRHSWQIYSELTGLLGRDAPLLGQCFAASRRLIKVPSTSGLRIILRLLDHEDEGYAFLRNVANYSPQTRRRER